MLYQHAESVNAAKGSDDADRSEWGERGLGAVTPHVANLRTTSGGGGGYGVLAVGGGSGSGDSSGTAAGGTQGPNFRTVGRNTSPFTSKAKAAAPRRNYFQATGQGSRVSGGEAVSPTSPKGSPGSKATFPAGGLFGLAGLGRVKAPAPADPSDIGLGDFFGWLGQRFIPPGGNIMKIQPIPSVIRNVIPSPIRTAVRLGGAGVQSVFFPILSGPAQRQMFGLNAGESGVLMKTQQISRMIIGAIATYGAGSYLFGGGAAGSSVAAGGAPAGGSPLGVGLTAPYTGFGSAAYVPAGYATPATFGGTAAGSSIFAGAAPAAAPIVGASTDLALTPAYTGFGSAAYVAPGYAAPGAFGATAPVASSSAGFMATHPTVAAALGVTGKTALDVATLGVVSKLLSPGMTPQAAPDSGSGYGVMAAQPQQAQPQVVQVPVGGGGGVSGGSDPQLAGPSLPMMLTVAGIAVTIGASILKRRRGKK